MNKSIVIFFFLLIIFQVKAQEIPVYKEVSVSKNFYGFQLGLVLASFQYEHRLARKWALHSEIGIAMVPYTIKSNSTNEKDVTTYISSPFLALEP